MRLRGGHLDPQIPHWNREHAAAHGGNDSANLQWELAEACASRIYSFICWCSSSGSMTKEAHQQALDLMWLTAYGPHGCTEVPRRHTVVCGELQGGSLWF
mmetsp:Transcript_9573/g.33934  ORF Transcript_9573/g.33934 Transcript_9573/m.33934 type:complete len:100 (+) Transcript_9573:1019-1318(+)